mgnify:CR=1 FL=1
MQIVTLDEVIKEIGIRAVAYAIYSLLIRYEPQILIVDTDKEAEMLDMFLSEILRDVYGAPTTGIPKVNTPFQTIKKEDYLSNWKKFVGKKLVFVKDDQNIRSEAVNSLVSLIERSLKSKFPPPEERFKSVIEGTLTTIYRVKGEIESRNRDLSKKEFYINMIKNSIVFEEQLPLILEIMKVHGYDLVSS